MTADELIRLLDELQQRLAGPARYVFDLAVKQVFIEGVAYLVGATLFTALLIGVTVVGIRFVRHRMEEATTSYSTTSYSSDPFDYAMLFLFGGLSLFIASIPLSALGLTWLTALSHLLNPEWIALQRIILTLKP